MTAERGGRADRSGGRTASRTGRRLEWPRTDRTGLLAVTLSLLTVLSLLAIPAAGATLAGSEPAASVGDGVSSSDPLANAAGGNGGGNGSNSGGGGSNAGSAPDQAGGSSDDSSGGEGSNDGSGSSGGSSAADESNAGGSGDGSNGDGASNSNGNAGANGNGNGNENGNENGNGKADDRGNGGASGSPGSAGGAGNEGHDVDVSVPAGSGAGGQSGAGGPDDDGPSDGAGPPEGSNAGGNGGGHGRPGASPGDAGEGGPSVSVTAGGQGERGVGVARGGSGGPTSVVSVAVENARAGDRVDLDVSPASVESDAVAFDGISATVERDGDFTMEVTNSQGRLPGSPAFEPDQAAESLGRIRLDHSITNDEVAEVTYTFRVSKARLEATDTDPEEVSLFRYDDGGWNELPTDVVGETESHYLLSSDSPGMSEFAVGAKRPDFDTFWADVGAGSVGTGETVTVRGRVTNDGGADGVYDAKLVVDGEVVAERSITIAAGGTRQVNFRTTLERPGDRRVSIDGVPAGEVTVEPRRDDPEDDGADPTMAVLVDRLLDVGRALGITSGSAGGTG